jgi:hypothetical protein
VCNSSESSRVQQVFCSLQMPATFARPALILKLNELVIFCLWTDLGEWY